MKDYRLSECGIPLIYCAPWGRGQQHFMSLEFLFGQTEILHEMYLRRHSMISEGTRVMRHVG